MSCSFPPSKPAFLLPNFIQTPFRKQPMPPTPPLGEPKSTGHLLLAHGMDFRSPDIFSHLSSGARRVQMMEFSSTSCCVTKGAG